MGHRGFTLIEIVLVMTLLGTMALVVQPSSDAVDSVGLSAAARRVRSDMIHVQQLAMTTGVQHGVRFTAGSGYLLYRLSPANPIVDPMTKQTFVTENLSRFGTINFMKDYDLRFDSKGAASVISGTPDGIICTSVGSLNGTRGFRATPVTGMIEITNP